MQRLTRDGPHRLNVLRSRHLMDSTFLRYPLPSPCPSPFPPAPPPHPPPFSFISSDRSLAAGRLPSSYRVFSLGAIAGIAHPFTKAKASARNPIKRFLSIARVGIDISSRFTEARPIALDPIERCVGERVSFSLTNEKFLSFVIDFTAVFCLFFHRLSSLRIVFGFIEPFLDFSGSRQPFASTHRLFLLLLCRQPRQSSIVSD